MVDIKGSLIIYFLAVLYILEAQAWQHFPYLRLENLRLEESIINVALIHNELCNTHYKCLPNHRCS